MKKFSFLIILIFSAAVSGLKVNAQCGLNITASASNKACLGNTQLSATGAGCGSSKISWVLAGDTVHQEDATYSAGVVVAGGNGLGSASNQIYFSSFFFLDANGNVYVIALNGVYKWTPNATTGVLVAGGNGWPPLQNGNTRNVGGVHVDAAGNVYVAFYDDNFNSWVHKWTSGAPQGLGTVVAGGNGNGSASNQLKAPKGIWVDGNGNVYVADNENHRVQKWAPGASTGVTIAGGNGAGTAMNQLNYPHDIFIDGNGNMYVSDSKNDRVQKWAQGASVGVTVAGGNGFGSSASQLVFPFGVHVDDCGNVYVSDVNNHRIQKWTPGANSGTTIISGINDLSDITVDKCGNIYVMHPIEAAVRKYSPTLNTNFTPTKAGNYTAVVSTGCCNAVSNSVTVYPLVAPAVSITAAPTTICAGGSVSFTATGTNAGTAPTYNFKVNGISAQSSSSNSFNSSSLKDGDVVTCVMRSNGDCISVDTAISNSVSITVAAPGNAPTISISSTGNSICSGTSATFTATISNGGSSPTYQWKVNGSNVGTNSNTYTSSAFNNGDIVTCELTSSITCITNNKATSNNIVMAVQSGTIPTINLTSTTTIACAGTSVKFTANATNAGSNASYNFKINGVSIQNTSSETFTTTALRGNDRVSCDITANTGCGTSTVTSNTIVMSNSTIVPNVTLSASATSICFGSTVNFTANSTNGGSSPIYTFLVNGNAQQSGSSATYSSSSLNNGDVVSCILISNAACATVTNDTSNLIMMQVTNTVTASVGITASSSSICTGSSNTFTAIPFNGGTNPTYNFLVNGVSKQNSNSNTFSSSSLQANDVVSCEMTSNANCVQNSKSTSNSIFMTQNAIVAFVSLSYSNRTYCPGTPIKFNAVAINGGTAPLFNFKVNGISVQNGTKDSLVIATLTNHDTVTCEMISNMPCVTNSKSASNPAVISMFGNLTPTLSIAVSDTVICSNENVSISFSGTNLTSPVTLNLKVNGVTVQTKTSGGNFNISTLKNNDVVTVEALTTDVCGVNHTTLSNAIKIKVLAEVKPDITIATSANNVCQGTAFTITATALNAGTNPTYTFLKNGFVSQTGSNNTLASTFLQNNDVIKCIVINNQSSCLPNADTSNSITIQLQPTTAPSVSMTASKGTLVCIGQKTKFTATVNNAGTNPTITYKVNGVVKQTGTNNTYETDSLKNNDIVKCEVVSNSPCATVTTASAIMIMNAINSVTPSISITANKTNICPDGTINVTASYTNAGTSPLFKFYVNDTLKQSSSSFGFFNSNPLHNGDVIKCVLINNAVCATSTADTSNDIVIGIIPSVYPTISLQSSADTVCKGSPVTFTATATNAGIGAVYEFKVNNVVAQNTTSNIFTSNTLKSTDSVQCILHSTVECAAISPKSNTIKTVVNSVVPSITIFSSANNICLNTAVNFTATVTNEGSSPLYNFLVNGVSVQNGANATYTTSNLMNNDVVSCILTSNAACAIPNLDTSNSVKMLINNLVTPTIQLTVSNDSICPQNIAVFTATATHAGTMPIYTFKKNGITVQSSNSNTYSDSAIANHDTITCSLTSNADCATVTTALSNKIGMTVLTVVSPTILIGSGGGSACLGSAFTIATNITNGGNNPIYNFKVNGASVQNSTSPTYTSSAFQNGDVIICELTSSIACAAPNPAISNAYTYISYKAPTPVVTINTNAVNGQCEGTSVNFFVTTTANGSTSFYKFMVNGTVVQNNQNRNYSSKNLKNGDSVYCIYTGTYNCGLTNTANSNGYILHLTPAVKPIATLAVNKDTICAGSTATFTATATNAGASPTYQFVVNGATKQNGTNAVFATDSLQTGDSIKCIVKNNDNCGTADTTNSIVMVVNASVLPTINLTSNTTVICARSSITFTATATDAGVSPIYNFKKNGTTIQSGASNTFTSSNFSTGDSVTCELVSSAVCAINSTVLSNAIVVTVAVTIVPSISVSTLTDTICSGASVTFNATAMFGGTNPRYQWKQNGNNVGTNSEHYTVTNLTNNDVVSCVLTSNVACAATTIAEDSMRVYVLPNLAPSVNISTPNTAICKGANTSFTANVVNGGNGTIYHWYNGATEVSNAATYSDTGIQNGDIIKLIITTNNKCQVSNFAVSNNIAMTINPNVTPTVHIAASITTICANTNITITANSTNGGTSPMYDFQVNGISLQNSNSSTFNYAGFTNNSYVKCLLTSSAACAVPPTVSSDSIKINVFTNFKTAVTLIPSTTTICKGSSVTFKAKSFNGGGSPSFEFKVNGVTKQNGFDTLFTTTTLNNNDTVQVIQTSSLPCAVPVVSASVKVIVTVTPPIVSSVSIVANNAVACSGTNVVFTATPVNGGSQPIYDFKVNGVSKQIDTLSTFNISTLKKNDTVTCEMTSNAACVFPATTLSNKIVVTINTTGKSAVNISADTNNVCVGTPIKFTAFTNSGGNAPVFIFKVNGVVVQSSGSNTFTSTTLNGNDQVSCTMISSLSCTPNSNSNIITVITNGVIPTINITASNNNFCSGSNVTFTATQSNGGQSPIYQWKINGNNVGTNSAVFNSSTISNNDTITCVMTANNPCQSIGVVSSNLLIMKVKSSSSVTPITGTLVACNTSAIIKLRSTTYGGVWSCSDTNIAKINSSGTITVLNNGTALISYTIPGNATTCPNAATALFTVAIPATPIITGLNALCLNDTTTLTGIPTGGIWIADNNRASVTASGLVTAKSAAPQQASITYKTTNASGCTASATKKITINTLPQSPSINYAAGTNVQAIRNGANFCANKTFGVVGNPANGMWSKTGSLIVTPTNTPSTNATVSTGSIASNNNTLTYTLTDSNGCSSSRTMNGNVVIFSSRGVNSLELIVNSYELYPNPSNGIFNLKLNNLIGAGSVVVTDLYGKQLAQQPLSMGINTIDASKFAKGMYLVSVITEQGKETKKLIIE